MLRILLSLILVAAMSVVALACPCLGNDEPCNCASDVKCGAQIANLPQDENKLYVTIFGEPSDARFQTVKNWFSENSTLKTLKAKTHFQTIETNSVMFKSRFAKNTPATLCIRVQAANGAKVCELIGDQVPVSSTALANSIESKCFDRWRKNHCCPKQEAAPVDEAPVDEAPVDEEPVAEEPAPEPAFPWGLLAAVVAGGLLAGNATGVIKKAKETYKGKK